MLTKKKKKKKKNISRMVYYDYLFLIEIVLRELAENICQEKFNNTEKSGLRRNSEYCLGILIGLRTNYIINFHIVCHGNDNNYSLISTDKHSKCMESISLSKKNGKTQLNNIHPRL